ncbi:MAG: hypothetical protein JEZ08_23155 [Clostridiales bacterium]|nr:hypothetical protein [Clostridiales bacterium]
MRTIFLIKQLLKASDLSTVSFKLDSDGDIEVQTDPLDMDLQDKIQTLLDREIDSFMNKID